MFIIGVAFPMEEFCQVAILGEKLTTCERDGIGRVPLVYACKHVELFGGFL